MAAGERVALVGKNGCGKSTLIKILAGIETADEGEVHRGRGAEIAYLAQEPEMDGSASALEVALSGLGAWSASMRRHTAVSEAIADASEVSEALVAEQAALAAAVERLGGWDRSHAAAAILGHLGIRDPERAVATFSGGERRRVALARLLVSSPEVAILDEPTNHLDIATIEWLEEHLAGAFSGAIILVTHDRYLLDRVATRTLEIDGAELYGYQGGWEAYLVGRAERRAHAARAESNRQNFLRRELEWLRRQPKARGTKQKARSQRALDTLGASAPAPEERARFALGAARTGKTILEARDLRIEVGGAVLVDELTLHLTAGERIGIVGANGAGKTTLLRTLLGAREAEGGSATIGKNTRVAYLDQNRADLDPAKTLYESVADGRALVTLGGVELEMRAYLERFLFDSSDQLRPVGSLSGGERARLALARTFSGNANLIVLDEPTNDLDVTTLAALEETLLDFPGTTLVVTHDRWFLDRIATRILSFEGEGRLVDVHGGYRELLEWRARQVCAPAPDVPAPEASPAPPAAAVADRKKLTYGESIELDGLLGAIDTAEAEVAALEGALASDSFAKLHYSEQSAALAELEGARQRVDALVERWSELEGRRGAGG